MYRVEGETKKSCKTRTQLKFGVSSIGTGMGVSGIIAEVVPRDCGKRALPSSDCCISDPGVKGCPVTCAGIIRCRSIGVGTSYKGGRAKYTALRRLRGGLERGTGTSFRTKYSLPRVACRISLVGVRGAVRCTSIRGLIGVNLKSCIGIRGGSLRVSAERHTIDII